MKIIYLFVLGLASTLSYPIISYAQSGLLDNTFDLDGMVTTDIGGALDLGYAVAVQADGKILVAGYNSIGSNGDFALVRYNSDGSLDNTFDGDGMVTTDFGTNYDYGMSLAIQGDGKIVMAGYSGIGFGSDIALARFNSNGSLDNSFDSDGKVITDIGASTNDKGYTVKIQSDGKIVVGGTTVASGVSTDFVVVRYNNDGSLDNSFDADGKVITDIGSEDGGNSIAIQSDGKIVLGGWSANGSVYDFAVLRYNTNGSLDNTFDADGKVTTNYGGGSRCWSVAVQNDGKIVLGGQTGGGSAYFALVRYNPNGSLDIAFDGDGIVTTHVGLAYDDYGYSVAIQNDNKILLAGHSEGQFVLIRYINDGSLDNSFGTGGIVSTVFGGYVYAQAVTLQNDGKIVVAGYKAVGNSDFAVARYNVSTIGISENINSDAVTVFPNPTTDKINIIIPEVLIGKPYQILDYSGRQVRNGILTEINSMIDISSLAKGVYIIQIGEQKLSLKLVKD